MYHLTILWLAIVADAATVAYLAGWRRGLAEGIAKLKELDDAR